MKTCCFASTFSAGQMPLHHSRDVENNDEKSAQMHIHNCSVTPSISSPKKRKNVRNIFNSPSLNVQFVWMLRTILKFFCSNVRKVRKEAHTVRRHASRSMQIIKEKSSNCTRDQHTSTRLQPVVSSKVL